MEHGFVIIIPIRKLNEQITTSLGRVEINDAAKVFLVICLICIILTTIINSWISRIGVWAQEYSFPDSRVWYT